MAEVYTSMYVSTYRHPHRA